MDVTGWPLGKRMELPDWCFGNRQLINVEKSNVVADTRGWTISTIALPDPVCIWQVALEALPDAAGTGKLRIGLADAVPTSEAEMDAADEIFPDYGSPATGPNYVWFMEPYYIYYLFNVRKGMVTGGKKLVLSCICVAPIVRYKCFLIVSGLPSDIPNLLAPETSS